ncbi:class I SAM-dependent RNA methyltransferase [Gordonia sp. DT30]|uniref:class I SAM-dependent RNA methyltransferase n=1 Tax=Gordonia sp. DT30 TaxID=3416546 RepID=UPI003CF52946
MSAVRDRLTLTVERPANGGAAVAHADDGRVVFVRGAIPGETVTATVVEKKSGFLVAAVDEVLDASAHRRPPRCAAAAHGAGCCDLDFIDIAHARTLKSQVLVDVLTRIGGFTPAALAALDGGSPEVGSLDDAESRWRIRTRMAVDGQGRAGLHEHGGAGIVVGHRCAQPDPLLSDLAALDGTFTPDAELAIVLDDAGRRHLTEIAPAATRPAAAARDRRRSAQQRRRRREQPRAQRVIEGEPMARHRVGERVWDIPVTGFWQGHRAAPRVYAQTVGEFVADHTAAARSAAAAGTDVATCWDLYGGAGVFAAVLTDQVGAREVHIVDSDAGALHAAQQTFGADGPITVHHGEVAQQIGGLPAPQVVVLDPPRTGAGARVIDQIVAAAPQVVVYVGCDVARFARDLRTFADRGYRTRAIRGFDAFPLTHHIEAIAVLVRSISR